jgi:hypothetical protein
MRFYDRFACNGYEENLQQTRYERQAETKRIERLSTILAKKVDILKLKTLSERVA